MDRAHRCRHARRTPHRRRTRRRPRSAPRSRLPARIPRDADRRDGGRRDAERREGTGRWRYRRVNATASAASADEPVNTAAAGLGERDPEACRQVLPKRSARFHSRCDLHSLRASAAAFSIGNTTPAMRGPEAEQIPREFGLSRNTAATRMQASAVLRTKSWSSPNSRLAVVISSRRPRSSAGRRWPLRPKLDNARAVWRKPGPGTKRSRPSRHRASSERTNAGRAGRAVVLMIVDSTTVEGV